MILFVHLLFLSHFPIYSLKPFKPILSLKPPKPEKFPPSSLVCLYPSASVFFSCPTFITAVSPRSLSWSSYDFP